MIEIILSDFAIFIHPSPVGSRGLGTCLALFKELHLNRHQILPQVVLDYVIEELREVHHLWLQLDDVIRVTLEFFYDQRQVFHERMLLFLVCFENSVRINRFKMYLLGS